MEIKMHCVNLQLRQRHQMRSSFSVDSVFLLHVTSLSVEIESGSDCEGKVKDADKPRGSRSWCHVDRTASVELNIYLTVVLCFDENGNWRAMHGPGFTVWCM